MTAVGGVVRLWILQWGTTLIFEVLLQSTLGIGRIIVHCFQYLPVMNQCCCSKASIHVSPPVSITLNFELSRLCWRLGMTYCKGLFSFGPIHAARKNLEQTRWQNKSKKPMYMWVIHRKQDSNAGMPRGSMAQNTDITWMYVDQHAVDALTVDAMWGRASVLDVRLLLTSVFQECHE